MVKNLAIEVRSLRKSYGAVQALRGVDLEVERGEVFGFLGPNGAGKTTTIRCLLGLIRPEAGTMRILGLDVRADPVGVRAQIGYLPGELGLEANLRVRDILRYFADLRGKRFDWSFAEDIAGRLELDLAARVKNLSKGNKQKVGVVQALMARPELLLLDEPTSGLDPLMQQEVYGLLREAQAHGATIFMSSHYISEVEALANRVAIIRAGAIVELAEPSRLADMAMRRVRVRFQRPVDAGPLRQIRGVSLLAQSSGMDVTLRVEGEMQSLVQALGSLPVRDLETEHPSLEEVFLAHYEGQGKEKG